MPGHWSHSAGPPLPMFSLVDGVLWTGPSVPWSLAMRPHPPPHVPVAVQDDPRGSTLSGVGPAADGPVPGGRAGICLKGRALWGENSEQLQSGRDALENRLGSGHWRLERRLGVILGSGACLWEEL